MTAINGARESVLAFVIERFVNQFDFSSLAPAQRASALREVALLRPTVGHNSPRLAAALKRFEDRLRFTKAKGGRKSRDSQRLNRLLRWLVPLAMSGIAAGTIGVTPAFAAHGTLAVGANVFNPVTQLNETVVEVIGSGYAVRTNLNHIIFLATAVNDTYSITSAGVTQSDEVDYTLHAPVVLSGVVIP